MSQGQGLVTRCHFGSKARRKQGQNDMPQLPNPDGEGRILWSEKSAAVEMPAVQQAIL
jgi:hypothetical protein